MDYAILGDTYSDKNINYLTQGVNLSGKAAKLNDDPEKKLNGEPTKRTNLQSYWVNNRPALLTPNQTSNLEKMQNSVNDAVSSSYGYDYVLGRLGLAVTEYERFCNVNGYRKLKTSPKVPNSTKKIYEVTKPEDIKMEEAIRPMKNDIKSDEIIHEEPVTSIIQPTFEVPKEEVKSFVESKPMSDVSATRVSRDVINTPDRFQERAHVSLNNDGYTPVNTLSRVEKNDHREETENRSLKVQVGKGEQDLNMISEKIHGNDGISAETSQIKEETYKMIQGTNQLNARNEELEEEKKAIIEKIKELNALKAERAKMANQKAKEEYKLAQRDNDEATHVYRDLTEQLKVLKAQLREAESSLDYDSSREYGSRMAA